ncbi:hypothetical protein EON62_06085, partial [archaeon]
IMNTMREKYGADAREVDMVSYIMYPQVYDEWMKFSAQFGDVSVVPTKHFVTPMRIGEEINFEIEKGKTLYVRLKAIGEVRSRHNAARSPRAHVFRATATARHAHVITCVRV